MKLTKFLKSDLIETTVNLKASIVTAILIYVGDSVRLVLLQRKVSVSPTRVSNRSFESYLPFPHDDVTPLTCCRLCGSLSVFLHSRRIICPHFSYTVIAFSRHLVPRRRHSSWSRFDYCKFPPREEEEEGKTEGGESIKGSHDCCSAFRPPVNAD